MRSTTPGCQQAADQADVYWRRRVAALGLGIAILALLAWTVNGAVGNGRVARQTADVAHLPGKAGHAPAPGARSAPAATGTATAAPSPAQSHQVPSRQVPSRTARPGRIRPVKATTARPGGTGCPGRDVVISLLAAQDSYGAGERPEFEVDVVSTAPRPCTFNVGSKNVRLLIRSGAARIWGSADCARGAGPRATELVTGVPQVLRMSWDRKTSVPGCQLARREALPGTYTAAARTGRLRSQTVVFVLRGRGVAVP